MIQEMQKKLPVEVDCAKDGQNDTPKPQKAGHGARLVLTPKARTDKAKVQKDPNVSPQV